LEAAKVTDELVNELGMLDGYYWIAHLDFPLKAPQRVAHQPILHRLTALHQALLALSEISMARVYHVDLSRKYSRQKNQRQWNERQQKGQLPQNL
jgi:hypothetical protein